MLKKFYTSDFGKIITGNTPSTQVNEYWNGEYCWITPSDLKDNKYYFKSDRQLTIRGLSKARVLPPNTLLVTCIASIGKNGILTVNGACNQQINAIMPLLKDKITCLAGQSAAGKSSLINLITGKKQCEVGQLSEKIQRGKNTTTAVSLVPVGENSYVADTPGFSLLDVFDIDADDLDLYYNVYVDLSDKCRYRRCKHIAEPGCEVKRRVDAGLLSKERYERYKQITSELQSKNKYKGGLL